MKEIILKIVNRLYGIDGNEILTTSRKQEYINVRYMLFYYLRFKKQWSLTNIGIAFNLDHSTVSNGLKRYQGFLDVSKEDNDTYLEFLKEIKKYEPLQLDNQLVKGFLSKNDRYLSKELKNYLNCKL